MEPAVQMTGLAKVFRTGGREVLALDGIDLSVAPGEFVCLLGPSGCGKSTLLNAIAGFAPPTAGTLLANGRPVAGPGPDRGMVFQEYALFPWMTVEANVAFGLELKGEPPAAIRARVEELLRQLALWEFRDRFPKDLSGGMRQRVAIARVLAIDPPMLLMDEPFGALVPRLLLHHEQGHLALQRVELGRGGVARAPERHRDDALHAPRAISHHHHPIGEVDGLLDAVRHEDDGLAERGPDPQ